MNGTSFADGASSRINADSFFVFFADSVCFGMGQWIECRAKQMNERLKTDVKKRIFRASIEFNQVGG